MTRRRRLNPAILGLSPYGLYKKYVLSTSPLAFWPLNEASGTTAYDRSGNGYNGAYTGVDLGQAGQGGETCPYFDGANDVVNVYSAGINAGWNRQECSVAIWAKPVNVGVWTDGIARSVFRFATTSTLDFFNLGKQTTNGAFSRQYGLNGTTKSVNLSGQSWTDWTHLAITNSVTADQAIFYLNGAASATQTGLGTSSGGALVSSQATIGATSTTPTGIWYGWLQYAAIWTRALSPTEVLRLATI